MNLILLFPEDFLPQTLQVCLKDRRQQHVLNIHRAVVGKELCVGLLNGKIGKGEVTRLTENDLEMTVRWESDPPAPLPVTLAIALPRPPILRRVLQTATTMGVKRIFLFHSFRVEKGFWKSHAMRLEDIQQQLVLGLEQARDTRMPEVFLCPKFRSFADQDLPPLLNGARGFVAHPGQDRPCPRGITEPAVLVVGPEGGFEDFEIKKFLDLGLEPVHLGQRILRVDTAVPALLGHFI